MSKVTVWVVDENSESYYDRRPLNERVKELRDFEEKLRNGELPVLNSDGSLINDFKTCEIEYIYSTSVDEANKVLEKYNDKEMNISYVFVNTEFFDYHEDNCDLPVVEESDLLDFWEDLMMITSNSIKQVNYTNYIDKKRLLEKELENAMENEKRSSTKNTKKDDRCIQREHNRLETMLVKKNKVLNCVTTVDDSDKRLFNRIKREFIEMVMLGLNITFEEFINMGIKLDFRIMNSAKDINEVMNGEFVPDLVYMDWDFCNKYSQETTEFKEQLDRAFITSVCF